MQPAVFATYPIPTPQLWDAVVDGNTETVLRLLGITSVNIHEVVTLTCTISDAAPVVVKTTAVQTAATLGRVDIMEILLQLGADVNSSSSTTRNTLMHSAVTYANEACVLSLVRHRADISIKNLMGDTALDIARRLVGHEAIIATLETEEVSRKKCIAFAMGHHSRLGKNSMMARLDPEVLRMVIDQV